MNRSGDNFYLQASAVCFGTAVAVWIHGEPATPADLIGYALTWLVAYILESWWRRLRGAR